MTQTQNRLQSLSPQKRALLEKLLAQKKQGRRPEETSIPRRDPSAPVPLSLGQQRMWITDLLDPTGVVYNISKAIQVDDVDAAVLESALVRIVNRLRSSIVLPMHWWSGGSLDRFLDAVSSDFLIERPGTSHMELSLRDLPSRPTVIVLEPQVLTNPED
ncbi:MAG: hypothetical protein AAFY88_15215 [Acidobacteriota bacterium]